MIGRCGSPCSARRTFVGTRSDPNNNSLVLRAMVGGVSILLTGDAEHEAQRALLTAGGPLRADVLKVPHHGSAYSELGFLDAVRPTVALVAVGVGNDYGHPNAGVLSHLRRHGATVLRTDQQGDVAIVNVRGGVAVVSPWSRHRETGPMTGAAHANMTVCPGQCPPRYTSCSERKNSSPPRRSRRSSPQLGRSNPTRTSAIWRRTRSPWANSPSCSAPPCSGSAGWWSCVTGRTRRKELVAALLAYAADPVDEVILLVMHAGGAKGKALADGFRGAGATWCRARRSPSPATGWRSSAVRSPARSAERTDEAAGLIIDVIGNDLRELASVCCQLVADTGGTVDAAAVTRYYHGRAEVTGFTVADAAMVGDAAGALEALRWALSSGSTRCRSPTRWRTGCARSPGSPVPGGVTRTSSPAASACRLEGRACAAAGAGLDPEGLATAMRVAANVNGEVKGGADDRVYVLERAVLAITEARGLR